jgi:hypothetical protein
MSEIIDFQSARAAVARASEIGSDCELFSHRRPRPAPTTETGRNGQLRKDRVKAWINAERLTRYWRTRMDFEDALRSVQTNGLAIGRFHDEIGENRIMLVKSRNGVKGAGRADDHSGTIRQGHHVEGNHACSRPASTYRRERSDVAACHRC